MDNSLINLNGNLENFESCNSTKMAILLYHGVTDVDSKGIENFSGKHIDVGKFEQQMVFIKRYRNVVGLREMANMLAKGGSFPRDSVAVTFDDSYKNVCDVALPILKQYEIPATFFISTGFVGTDRRFVTDHVEHIINKTSNAVLNITLNGEHRQFDLSNRWGRIEAVIEIKGFLKKNPTAGSRILKRLQERLGVPDNGNDVENYRNLSWEDVRKLYSPPFLEVGGHTVNHAILSLLDEKELIFEIRNCKKELEKRLGHTIDLFSYPEGQPDHFSERVILIPKQEGIKICPSAINGVNFPGTGPFYLKRIMVGFMNEKFPFPDVRR